MVGPTETAQTGTQDALGSAASQAQEKVGAAAEQARERAVQAKEEGRNLVRAQVEERSSQAGQQLHSTAQDLRKVASTLREQGNDAPARIAEQVADKGEQLAGYLRTSDGERLLRDMEQFARRQPWAVVAGGLFVGFAASRLLKSSSVQRYNSNNTSTRSADRLRADLEARGAAVPPPDQVSGFSESPAAEGL